jgi:hypothetical protein
MQQVRHYALGIVATIALAAGLGGNSTPAGAATGCASPETEARRAEQNSTYLPDCRAYELVTPPGAAAQQQTNQTEGGRAAAAGGALTWFSFYPPPGFSGAGMHFLSKRSSTGWQTEAVIPPLSTGSTGGFECSANMYYSEELTQGVLEDGRQAIGRAQSNPESCSRNEPPLIDEQQASTLEGEGLQAEPEGFQNLFMHEPATSLYKPINLTPKGVVPADAWFQGASADFSHVVFSDEAKLTAGAPSGEAIYEWVGARVHLISVLPSGTAVAGAVVDGAEPEPKPLMFNGSAPYRHAVSQDGTRVIFEAGGDLFVRVNAARDAEVHDAVAASECGANACTIHLDASHANGPGGGGRFLAASEDGSRIFFTDSDAAQLTGDTEAASGQNLYEYDVETGNLTDLTPHQSQAGVLGLTAFGEEAGVYRLYFVAEGALTTEPNVESDVAQPGKPNMYLIEAGRPNAAFIATLTHGGAGGGDRLDWEKEGDHASASPNGRFLVFHSLEPITGFDNTPLQSSDCTEVGATSPCEEIYLYEAGAGRLHCVSCAAGSKPTGPTSISPDEPSSVSGAAPGYLRRNVLNDGVVFFDTPNALVPQDANGKSDVYEYEAGADRLISSGAGATGSYFLEASGYDPATGQEGAEAFFITGQHLLGADTGTGPAVYDARTDGGFAEPASVPLCAGEACRGATSEATFSVPGSATSTGPGNLQPPPELRGKPKSNVRRPTRAQALAKALAACKKQKNKTKRAACRRTAEKKYGPVKRAKRRAR